MSTEVKGLIEELGTTFEQFKQKNDERLAAIEKGGAESNYKESLDAMNAKMSDIENQLKDIEKKSNRPGLSEKEEALKKHQSAFDKFVRKGDESAMEEIQAKASQVGVNADGGFAVPETVDSMIEELLRDATPMRQVCRVIQTSNENYRKLVNLGAAASGWVGETDARPETGTPQLQSLSPSYGEIYANPAATQKSLDDVMFSVEDWISREVVEEFAQQENAAFTSGDGTNKPKGILDYTISATPTFGQIQQVKSGVAGAYVADELISLVHSLKVGYRANAQFMTNNESIEALRKLKDADNNYLWRPGLERGAPSMLLGYNIVENEDMPAVAADANSMLFGDFNRAYTIVDVRGTRVLRDPYTNKPYVHFYTTKRVGGFLVNSEAIAAHTLGV